MPLRSLSNPFTQPSFPNEPVVSPHVYTIPPWQPFLQTLVQGLITRYWQPDDPLAFSQLTILLPTRRAVRAIMHEFVRVMKSNGHLGTDIGVILPTIRPIGDVNEDELLFLSQTLTGTDIDSIPPAIPELKRQFLLARLIKQWFDSGGLGRAGRATFGDAFAFAADLSRFLDAAQTDQADLSSLANVVDDNFADHWQQTLAFLNILEHHWPDILTATGFIDPADRRNRLLTAYADKLAAAPPAHPVVAAGSTGSIKATGHLLHTIAQLPAGAVVLPGLDQSMDHAAWAAVDLQHPQYGLKELLDHMGLDRGQVAPWAERSADHPPAIEARFRLISEALKPADATNTWRRAVERFETDGLADGLDGLSLIESDDEFEEANVIALILREAYEDPSKTAALVTPDRILARRVIANLKRWNITVDDSAGTPFLQTWPGMFLKQIIECVTSGMRPSLFLNVLKHPLCRLGRPRAEMRDLTARLEKVALRRLGAVIHWDTLRATIRTAYQDSRPQTADELCRFVSDLEAAFAPHLDALRAAATTAPTIAACAEAHIRIADALSRPPVQSSCDTADEPAPTVLWAEEAGEIAADFMRDLFDHGADMAGAGVHDYAEIFTAQAARLSVRKPYGATGRLSIWGPLEARLQKVDLVILGGLNETTWPTTPALDPWANRPARAAIGMQLPERKIGLSAHDFSQLTVNDRVVLSRALRADGAPTVPARWLLRLEAILDGAGQLDRIRHAPPYAQWAASLDICTDYQPEPPPAPAPPVEDRPRSFSVSDIQTWVRDPYALYAKRILRLRPLDDLEALPDAATFGTIAHQVLHDLAAPGNPPADLSAIIDNALTDIRPWADVHALWQLRLHRIAAWYMRTEAELPEHTAWLERPGSASWALDAGPVELRARADRLNLAGTGLQVIDYKTGFTPSIAQVKTQLEPQLPLEGLIAESGGFDGVAAQPVRELIYIKLSGRPTAFERRVIAAGSDAQEILTQTKDGFLNWVRTFDNPAMPYRSRPRIQLTSRYGDYDHLARVKEWSAADSGDGDG